MSAPKVKNLVILVLLLVNLFLLALVLPSRYDAARSEQESNRQLSQLFQTSGILLTPESIIRGESLCDQTLTADTAARTAAVMALLGESTAAEQTADGQRFTSSLGTAVLTDGTLTAVVSIPAEDPEAFTKACLDQMDVSLYSLEQTQSGDAAEYRCSLAADGIPVHDAELTFRYEGGRLTRVQGLLLPKKNVLAPDGSQVCLSARDALVKFLGSRLSTGWMGSSVHSVEQAWLISRSTGESLSLRPVWRIRTDAGLCLVNGITGDVTLQG